MPLNVTLSFPESADASAALAEGAKVQRYELREAMSELFELTVEVLTTDPGLDDRAFVGQRVTVDFGDEPFLKQIQGIVRQMVQRTAVSEGDSKYELVIVPPLWLTTRRRDQRIFQHLSAPKIAAAVVADKTYGGRIAAPALPSADPPEREYCVQYNETDWHFLSRILADQGIATYFDHAQGSVWTLVDDTSASAPESAGTVLFSDPSHPNPLVLGKESPHILSAEILSSVEPTGLVIRDYDFEKPDNALEARALDGDALPGEGEVETYTFEVGKFTEQAPGDTRAAALLDGERAFRRLVRATATFSVAPGTRLKLEDHPRADLNGDFLVVRSHAVVTFGAASVRELHLIPLSQRFRPKHVPKPQILGTHTAFVVCAEGQEIDVDVHGRVEVAFKWDRRDKDVAGICRRVRVAQGWAGPGYGFVTLPRKGHEVIVAYLDGDPDEPIIIGRVHNGTSRTPLDLPKDKAVSVWRSRSTPNSDGYNQILMDDAAGSERLDVHAQKDMTYAVEHDWTTTVGHDRKTTIKGDDTTTILGTRTTHVVVDRNVSSAGELNVSGAGINVDSSKTLKVHSTGNMTLTSDADRTDNTASNHFIYAGSVYVDTKSEVHVVTPHFHVYSDDIRLIAGGSSILISSGGIKITSSGVVEVNGGLVKLNCD